MAYHSRRTPPVFPRRDLFRLMSMMMLLVVIGMLMFRTRDPAMWRWLANDVSDNDATAAQPQSVPLSSEKDAGSDKAAEDKNKFVETMLTGPNDQQPFEQSQAEYLYQAVSDKTPMAAEDMPAYWKLMRWSMTQSFDDLWQRARKDFAYTHLAEDPERLRGNLIALKVTIHRCLKHDAPQNSQGLDEIYQADAVTNESRTGLYSLVFYDQPPQLPLGMVHEQAVFVGYFLKLYSYEDAMGKQRWAPILIGRLRWRENLVRTALRGDRSQKFVWPWMLGCVAVVGLIMLWTKRYLAFGQVLAREPQPVDHAAIENWLESGASAAESDLDEQTADPEELWAEDSDTDEELRPESLHNLDSNSLSRDAQDDKST